MALTLDKAFNPRHNSIGFLRWLMAFAVIFSHAGPLAGFYGGKNLGTQWSDEQSFGGVAVGGFFFLSGFLITKSRMGRSTIFRFFWRRMLRIFPAFWAALLLTAFVLAPIAWWHVHGTIRGYVSSPVESPLTYFGNNCGCGCTRTTSPGLGQGLPLAQCCGYDWNGSAWTLLYEFKGYILVGVLGLFGMLGYRLDRLAGVRADAAAQHADLPVGQRQHRDPRPADEQLLQHHGPHAVLLRHDLRALGRQDPDRRPAGHRRRRRRVHTYFIASGWNVYGQFAFLYVLMWAAVRLPLQNWERFGDLSYGIYIYAWPIQQFVAFFGVFKLGWIGYHLVVVVLCHVAAFLSWHLLEKRALSLKNWTPRWLAYLLARLDPLLTKIKRVIVNPDYSSTHLRARHATGRRGAGRGPSGGRAGQPRPGRAGPPRRPPSSRPPRRRPERRRTANPAGMRQPPAASESPPSSPRRRPRLPLRHQGRRTMAVAPTAPPTKSPSSSPEAPRRRRVLHWVVGVVGVLAFVLVAWVFPAVYHDRYDPATKAGATPAVVDDPAWHPVPTPEQDQVYLQQTRTSAAHPGAAVEGRDGFLFLGDDYMANFAQAMGRRYYSREEVQTTVDAEKNRDAWLAKRGIASEFFVVPAKWSIYPDKLPAWTDGQVLPHVLDQLVTADAASFPDLRPALKQARSTADTYSKLNSHWTQYGAYVGFQAIAARLQKDHPEVGQLAVPTLSGTTTVDANNEFAAITGAPGPNNWTQPTFAQPLPSYTVVKPDGSRTTVPGTQLLDITQMPLQTESSAAGNNHRALILADSATTSLSPYLAHAFGTTMMVRHWMDVPTQAPEPGRARRVVPSRRGHHAAE